VRSARAFTTVAISIAILLLLLVNIAPGHAATIPHGCAPLVPPSVHGTPVPPPVTPGIIVINELLNNPVSNWNCSEPAGTSSLSSDSWVELYNPQNQPFNLFADQVNLDDGPNTFAFAFPFGAAIAAHGYLVVFPDQYAGILNGGSNLRFRIGDTVIDQISIPALAPDTSYARIPDGSANWQITTTPTIDASNTPLPQTTPTPVPTKRSGNSGNSSTSNGGTTPTLVTGKQPDWTKLQLPATNSSAPSTSNSPLVASPAASTTSSAWDVPRRILLTALVIALALSLFWCWKLFSSP